MMFQVHEPERSRGDGRGIATLRVLSGGRLVLNAAAKSQLGGLEFVQLLWDEDTKRIGIKPTKSDDPSGNKVSYAASQATISSSSFIKAHDLPYGTRMKLERDGEIWVASTVSPADPLG